MFEVWALKSGPRTNSLYQRLGAGMPRDPPLTRAALRSQIKMSGKDQQNQEPVLEEQADPLPGPVLPSRADSPLGDQPASTKSAARSTKRRRKPETKTEKRFQRLEAMMSQTLQIQTGGIHPRPKPPPDSRHHQIPATPSSAVVWRPDADPAQYGLPRPVIPLPTMPTLII